MSGRKKAKGKEIPAAWASKVVMRPLGSLRFAEYNPRHISELQRAHLKSSLVRFGFVEPVVVNINPDREGIIIGGEQRVRVATDLGYDEVPCVEVSLSLEQEKELNVRLNRNVGEWDWDKLVASFAAAELIEFGFEEWELPPMESNEPFVPDGEMAAASVPPASGEEIKPTIIKCPSCGHEWMLGHEKP